MRMFSKSLMAALIGTALISSCSRPVAYFQPTAREQFKSVQSEIVTPTDVATMQPVTEKVAASEATVVVQNATPAEQVAQAKQAVSQIEAYVRNDNKLASNKKLVKRMDRVKQLLSNTSANDASSLKATSAQKNSLIQKVMLKRVDKKIKNHLSPERTMAKSLLTIGLIVGVIGLVLLLVGTGGLATLGYVALIVGLILVLVDLLR
ncbi:hypothetical protein [Spirosoma spitsbergense]|uniref:hypothetical protein n=1 Tax=Spirosoma spitsbergense TaxID=431554 RepID=UPI000477731D